MISLSASTPPVLPPADQLLGLIELLSDPAAVKARVAELNNAAAEARAALVEAQSIQAQASADRKKTDADIRALRATHDQAIANERATFEKEMARRCAELDARQTAVALREADAADGFDRASKLKADLTRRLEGIRSLAGGLD